MVTRKSVLEEFNNKATFQELFSLEMLGLTEEKYKIILQICQEAFKEKSVNGLREVIEHLLHYNGDFVWNKLHATSLMLVISYCLYRYSIIEKLLELWPGLTP